MSDPIYARYKAREEAQAAATRQKQESDEVERLRLLETVPAEVERAFERLEAIDYNDETIKCMFRKVRPESGEVRETATWAVGQSRSWRWTFEDEATDTFILSSDRQLWRSKGVHNSDSRTVFIPLDPSTLYFDELQSLMNGLRRVGMRKADLPRGR